MTAILGAGHRDCCILVCDRRMTTNGGTFVADSNKMAMLFLRDARLAVAFTGISGAPASVLTYTRPTDPGSFRTSQWMLETLLEVAPPEREVEPTLARFAEAATRAFRPYRVPFATESVMVGFAFRQGVAQPSAWVVRMPGSAEMHWSSMPSTSSATPLASVPRR